MVQIASGSSICPNVGTPRTSTMQDRTYPTSNETEGGQWGVGYAMGDSPHTFPGWDGQTTTHNK